ncbi:unnamed protein product [Prunus armeniaca]
MTVSELSPRHRACERAVRPLRHSREPCPFVSYPCKYKNLAFFISLYSFSFIPTCSSGLPLVASLEPRLSHIHGPLRHGLIQMVFSLLLSNNYSSFWNVDVGQSRGVAEIPSRPWGRMIFLRMRPQRDRNVYDEDGRAWYDNSNSAMSAWPSILVASMIRVTALVSPSHSCVQNDDPGHGQSDGLDCELVSLVARVTSTPMVGMTALILAGCTRVPSDGPGRVRNDGLDCDPVLPMSRVASALMAGETALILAGCTHVPSGGPGRVRNDGLDCDPILPVSRMTALPSVAASETVGGGGTA